MKQLTCEMCGGTDLMKKDGVFVCQSCGCKYSVEEAKRMMVEGTVDVKGTVQVDNSAFVKKYLDNARRAKQKEDWEETEKYYNMVEQNDPDNIEAIFYSAYGRAKASLVENDIYKRQSVFKVLNNCVSIIDDKYKVEDREQNEIALRSMAADLLALFTSNFVYTEWKNGYGVVTKTNRPETHALFVNLIEEFHRTMLNIQAKDQQLYMYDICIIFVQQCKKLTFEGYNRGAILNIFDDWIAQQQRAKDGLVEMKKRAKITAYWEQHKEEKEALEAKKNGACARVVELNKMLEKLPETSAVQNIEAQIATLNKQKQALGIFKGKEKKELQEQIDKTTKSLDAAKEAEKKARLPIQTEVESMHRIIKSVNEELAKER